MNNGDADLRKNSPETKETLTFHQGIKNRQEREGLN